MPSMWEERKMCIRDRILSYVRTCVEYEEAVKSGRLQDRLAVELLITKEY